MWSDPILAAFVLLCPRISDRNMSRQERFVLAHDSRGLAAHRSREDEAEE